MTGRRSARSVAAARWSSGRAARRTRQRLDKIGRILTGIADDWIDRYGEPSKEIDELIAYVIKQTHALRADIHQIDMRLADLARNPNEEDVPL